MLNLTKKYNLIAKEHNGDWVSHNIITKKYNIGLKLINSRRNHAKEPERLSHGLNTEFCRH